MTVVYFECMMVRDLSVLPYTNRLGFVNVMAMRGYFCCYSA